MPAWNGSRALFGTNPIAAVFPRSDAAPLTIDLSLSEVARGKVMLAAQQGKPIPLGWALDRAGKPTTDAKAALDGMMLPAGGVKGAMLALVVELLCASLTGAHFGYEADSFFVDAGNQPRLGQAFLVIDPAALAGADVYHSRVEALIKAMCADADVRLPEPAQGAACATRGDRRCRDSGCIAGAIDRAGRTAIEIGVNGIILLAHGSRDPQWALPFEQIRAAVESRKPSCAVALAYLEHTTPDFAGAVDDLVRAWSNDVYQGCPAVPRSWRSRARRCPAADRACERQTPAPQVRREAVYRRCSHRARCDRRLRGVVTPNRISRLSDIKLNDIPKPSTSLRTSPRSMLFVSGENAERFPKAMGAGADLVCIDLEDAVHADRKQSAREQGYRLG